MVWWQNIKVKNSQLPPIFLKQPVWSQFSKQSNLTNKRSAGMKVEIV